MLALGMSARNRPAGYFLVGAIHESPLPVKEPDGLDYNHGLPALARQTNISPRGHGPRVVLASILPHPYAKEQNENSSSFRGEAGLARESGFYSSSSASATIFSRFFRIMGRREERRRAAASTRHVAEIGRETKIPKVPPERMSDCRSAFSSRGVKT